MLKREYYLTQFPDPVVPDTEFCKHINSAAELKKAAIQFRNCLKSYVPESLRNEVQYYRWYDRNRPVAVISLKFDRPYGWRIDESFGKDNIALDDELELKIIKHFESHGVYKMSSMEALLRELGGMLNRGRSHRNDQVVHEFNIATEAMHLNHSEEMMMMIDMGILETDKINRDLMAASEMAHSDPNSLLLEPNESGEVIWTFDGDATLELSCNVPGHRESGMFGPIMMTQ